MASADALVWLLKDADRAAAATRLLPCLDEVQRALEDGRIAPSAEVLAAACAFLRDSKDAAGSDQVAALWRLVARLLRLLPQAAAAATKEGLIEQVTVFLDGHIDEPEIVGACLAVLCALVEVEGADSIIYKSTTPSVLAHVLQRYEASETTMLELLDLLVLMPKRTRHRRSMEKQRMLSHLIELVRRCQKVPRVLDKICEVLSNFSERADGALSMFKNGGVDALKAAFDFTAIPQVEGAPSPTDCRATAAAGLRRVAAECQEAHERLYKSGWLASLAAVTQEHPHHARLLQAALGIVRDLSKTAEFREDIVQLEFPQSAVKAMQMFRDQAALLKEGCGLFGNLAADPELAEWLGQIGALEEVVAALRSCQGLEERKTAKLAIGALVNLATTDSNREVLVKLGVVKLLLIAGKLYFSVEHVLDYTIGAISHLAVNELGAEHLAQEGGIQALVGYINDHMQEPHVVGKSFLALRRLLRSSQDRKWEVAKAIVAGFGQDTGWQGCALVTATMVVHMGNSSVVKEGALLLTGLAECLDLQEWLGKFAFTTVLKGVETHQEEADVVKALLDLAAHFPIEECSGRSAALDAVLAKVTSWENREVVEVESH